MRMAEIITKLLNNYIKGNEILEVACGDAAFSIAAETYARRVIAIDISLERVSKGQQLPGTSNIEFKEMDAAALHLPSDCVDAAICYNALAHLSESWPLVMQEMKRVTRADGHLILIGTWKMERKMIDELSTSKDIKIKEYIVSSKYSILIIENE